MSRSLYMMIGLPGSGKSTTVDKFIDDYVGAFIVVSTDAQIESWAKNEGKTYDQCFAKFIGPATTLMKKKVEQAIEDGLDIIWDQTNLTVKSRASKLKMFIGYGYEKCAVEIYAPARPELDRRLANRPGKTIPKHILDNMIDNYVSPTLSEGFDDIFYFDYGLLITKESEIKECKERYAKSSNNPKN
jgi:predicted kinase